MKLRAVKTFVLQVDLALDEASEFSGVVGTKTTTISKLYSLLDAGTLDPIDHPTVMRLVALTLEAFPLDILDREIGMVKFESQVKLVNTLLDVRVKLLTTMPKVK